MSTPPPPSTTYLLSYPSTHALLVTINRPESMNSAGHWEAHSIFQWFDNEPSLRIAIITGAGTKPFCAGQDLIEQHKKKKDGPTQKTPSTHSPGGFAALSRRVGKKPVIAAVNGFALGGGFEICLNCDLVVASPKASFGLPESKVGLYAGAGGLARVVRNCGLQLGSEIGLTGRRLSAGEAKEFHLINAISKAPESLMEDALKIANHIASLSPDATFVTRQGLREAWETASVERATQFTADRWSDKLMSGQNAKLGLAAFASKTKPLWIPSNL